jgi:hypothetical protein
VVPEAELHVFGYDYPPEGPAELASSQSEGVYWRGCLTKGELARELRSAALMAYPARHRETFCMAVAEAQAAGQAVVTSRCGALPERVSHGVDGYIIRTERAVRDWDQPDQEDYGRHFVSAVVRLLKDDEIQEQMGREAAAKARKTYDWEAIAGEWERMLQELVRGRDPRPPPLRPGLDLFDPSLLMLSAEGASARVSPSQVEEWLWTAWEAYGFSWESIPGLHTRRVLRAHSP